MTPKHLPFLLLLLTRTLMGNGRETRIWSFSNRRERVILNPSETLYLGTVYPDRRLRYKEFKAVADGKISDVMNDPDRFSFVKDYKIEQVVRYLKTFAPKPLDVLDLLCDMLEHHVNTIMIFTTMETDMRYGGLTQATQYLINMAGYLGIPIMAWNADNAGFDLAPDALVLQMAPSIDDECAAILDFMQRYNWRQFTIVTPKYVAGYDNFIQAVRRAVVQRKTFTFTILETVILQSPDLSSIKATMKYIKETSDTRIFVLYATTSETKPVFTAAHQVGLTTKEYMWLVTQAAIGTTVKYTYDVPDFPLGTIGTHFRTHEMTDLVDYAGIATQMWLNGFQQFYTDITSQYGNISLKTNSSCYYKTQKWHFGPEFFQYISQQEARALGGSTGIIRGAFTPAGKTKYPSLEFLNWGTNNMWEHVGRWTRESLEITDITWPGNSLSPPKGVPEGFNLTVVTLEESPFVISKAVDKETGVCSRGVKCRIGDAVIDSNGTEHAEYKCCSGLAIDILEMLSRDLHLAYQLYRVNDGLWGGLQRNGSWNGLVQDLILGKADMCVTSLKITPKRQAVIDFSTPYMHTGIAVVVALREGTVSTTAFLQPFDLQSWVMILVVCINGTALFVFLFEWMSPYGYNMKMKPPRGRKFSLFRSLWLMYTILFAASTHFDQPRGFVSRAISNVWALFSLVFLASYTANLIKFMIATDVWYDLKGIEDPRLQAPYNFYPPFKYATVPHGSTEEHIKQNYPDMQRYMEKYNTKTVDEGIKKVKSGELHAFVYDSKALDCKVRQDTDCRLMQVGNWFATTGYGIAFPKNSKYIEKINKRILAYRNNGELERLERFWFMGDCIRQQTAKSILSSTDSLQIKQLSSTFFMLLIGLVLSFVLLPMEYCFFYYVRRYIRKVDKAGVCGLMSISMGQSLSFTGAMEETLMKQGRRTKSGGLLTDHLRYDLPVPTKKFNKYDEQSGRRHRLEKNNSIPNNASLQCQINDSVGPYRARIRTPSAEQLSEVIVLKLPEKNANHDEETLSEVAPSAARNCDISEPNFENSACETDGSEDDMSFGEGSGLEGAVIAPSTVGLLKNIRAYQQVPNLDAFERVTEL